MNICLTCRDVKIIFWSRSAQQFILNAHSCLLLKRKTHHAMPHWQSSRTAGLVLQVKKKALILWGKEDRIINSNLALVSSLRLSRHPLFCRNYSHGLRENISLRRLLSSINGRMKGHGGVILEVTCGSKRLVLAWEFGSTMEVNEMRLSMWSNTTLVPFFNAWSNLRLLQRLSGGGPIEWSVFLRSSWSSREWPLTLNLRRDSTASFRILSCTRYRTAAIFLTWRSRASRPRLS